MTIVDDDDDDDKKSTSTLRTHPSYVSNRKHQEIRVQIGLPESIDSHNVHITFSGAYIYTKTVTII